jgi:hypothetical protein
MKGKDMATKKELISENYVRMYYEHQYDRVVKGENYRLTITNYVLTVSALAFTFGYQNTTQLTIINGIGLPLIIFIVNIFAIAYIERTSKVGEIHIERAHQALNQYAPGLNKINEEHKLPKKGFLGGQRELQKALHVLLVLVALIPVVIYLYQFM